MSNREPWTLHVNSFAVMQGIGKKLSFVLIKACFFRHVNICLYIIRNMGMHLHALEYVYFQIRINMSTCFEYVCVQLCIFECACICSHV